MKVVAGSPISKDSNVYEKLISNGEFITIKLRQQREISEMRERSMQVINGKIKPGSN